VGSKRRQSRFEGLLDALGLCRSQIVLGAQVPVCPARRVITRAKTNDFRDNRSGTAADPSGPTLGLASLSRSLSKSSLTNWSLSKILITAVQPPPSFPLPGCRHWIGWRREIWCVKVILAGDSDQREKRMRA
jgi:hypothetical protein